MDLEKEIRKLALLNAQRFGGKANFGSVVGALIQQAPDSKSKLKEFGPLIQKIVSEVNALGAAKQKELLESFGPIEEKKKEKREGLKPLPDAVMGNVFTRIAPSPSGRLHIGHAYQVLINYLYAKMYNGKFYLRIEDTNPENIELDAYKEIEKEVNWLTLNGVTKTIVQSGRLDIYYKYVEKLLGKDVVYVCECDSEKFKYNLSKKKTCPCREFGKDEQKKRWKKMFKGYSQGEAVMRVKTDVAHKNPAMRDFPIVRINDAKHPKTGNKHRVWPLMNLSVFVDDVELKITHTIRGKDHMDNAKRQEYLYNYLGLKAPVALFNGKINFFDMELSKTKTKALIEQGKYSGWDDVRIPFIGALKKRGFMPLAFHKWVENVGMTQVDKKVSKKEFFKSLNSFSRGILEHEANRYFFVENPVEIEIKGAPEQKVLMGLHPDFPKRGNRKVIAGSFYLISKDDFEKVRDGKIFRLIDCLNAKYANKEFSFDSKDYYVYKKVGGHIIHWLPLKDNLKAEVYMDDGSIAKGMAEPAVSNLKKGDVLQFERFGFVRFDRKEGDVYVFNFAHK